MWWSPTRKTSEAIETAARDIRYAVRQLLRAPGFILVAVGGLALGIGANVALSSVVNSVFLRPLPYHEPDRLASVRSLMPASSRCAFG